MTASSQQQPPGTVVLDVETLLEASGGWSIDNGLLPACRHVLQEPGKQLRPALVLAAAELGGCGDRTVAHRAAAAVELVHVASLLHDDVMDDGRIRRGRPTVGALYGKRVSVLGGAWLFARASWLMAHCQEPLHEWFAETSCAVCEGQMLEVRDTFDVHRTAERYYECVVGKTASLIALATSVGAVVGGLASESVDALRSYGHELGVAFQLADDILDLTASAETLGKAGGADLAHGVYTLPTILAMEADADLRQRLAAGVRPFELPEVGARVRELGVPGAVAALRERVGAARAALTGLGDTAVLERLLEASTLDRVEPAVVS